MTKRLSKISMVFYFICGLFILSFTGCPSEDPFNDSSTDSAATVIMYVEYDYQTWCDVFSLHSFAHEILDDAFGNANTEISIDYDDPLSYLEINCDPYNTGNPLEDYLYEYHLENRTCVDNYIHCLAIGDIINPPYEPDLRTLLGYSAKLGGPGAYCFIFTKRIYNSWSAYTNYEYIYTRVLVHEIGHCRASLAHHEASVHLPPCCVMDLCNYPIEPNTSTTIDIGPWCQEFCESCQGIIKSKTW